jgi:hypothetical protein
MEEVFKLVVLSSEEARSHGVKALCLVDRYWNNVANATSDLWTKVTLTYPLHADQLSAAQKWLKASEPKVVDVEADFRDLDFCQPGKENWDPSADPTPLQGMIAVLRGSEHRWRSISIKSDSWSPIREFLRSWIIPCPTSLPALESISFEGFKPSPVQPIPQKLVRLPALPKLREVVLRVVPVDWTLAAATSFQNLRKLVIRNNPHAYGPTLRQVSEALLVASPRLETLEVGGYHPLPDLVYSEAQQPFVHLPALKHLVLGWEYATSVYPLLAILQIPETLETLCLTGKYGPDGGEARPVISDSTIVFGFLADLGSSGSKNERPCEPWISMFGLKSLSLSSVYSEPGWVTKFLKQAPNIEEIYLTDIHQEVLEAIVIFDGGRSLQSERFNIRWNPSSGYISKEHRFVMPIGWTQSISST